MDAQRNTSQAIGGGTDSRKDEHKKLGNYLQSRMPKSFSGTSSLDVVCMWTGYQMRLSSLLSVEPRDKIICGWVFWRSGGTRPLRAV